MYAKTVPIKWRKFHIFVWQNEYDYKIEICIGV